MALPKIVSLFSGAGGLDLGFKKAGFPLTFAVDLSTAAIQTHKRNFGEATSVAADLVELGSDGVLAHLGHLLEPGESIGVIGGRRARDFRERIQPRTRMIREIDFQCSTSESVEALQSQYVVEFVLFENVWASAIRKHSVTFRGILSRFRSLV
jgi:DNA (cytosine-5)-methyltransferase 1